MNINYFKSLKKYLENDISKKIIHNKLNLVVSNNNLKNNNKKYYDDVNSIINSLFKLSYGGSIIIKLDIKSFMENNILLNIVYHLYNNCEKLFFYKPISTQISKSSDFYVICKGYMLISDDILHSFIDQVEVIKTTGINFDQMIDEYPLSYLYQLIFILDKLGMQYVYLLEKDYFFLNNNNKLNNKLYNLIRDYFIEHNIEWMKKYKM
jgi:hypothetical protein